eukprot:m.187379 g.187379  ORF g.187379 m.187379 type:complete len:606 (+) comp10013_c0_seq2:412-2229(+)
MGAVLLALSALVVAAAAYSPFNYGAKVPGMQWYSAAKFGMFIHWGPVSQWGTEISFPLVCEQFPCVVAGPNNTRITIFNADQLQAHREAYAALMHTFNPVDFDPDNMAALAKKAGFEYMVYTTIHCDGFVNWQTKLTDYNIMNTPFHRDVFGELTAAFRKQGIRVGAYICPSFWNNNSYWAPNALTALGPVCNPNYSPSESPALWNTFTSYLHGLVTELADQYAPDMFWFDCYNNPPKQDTRVDQLIDVIRGKNPEAVVVVRNGPWTDIFETDDQSEALVQNMLGQQQMSAGFQFEIPSVLQASRQWAYDPKSAQKSPATVLANLILLNSKGGNYLLNVAPSPLGTWAPGAVDVLQELADWFSVNGEAFAGTAPLYPFEFDGAFLQSRPGVVYALFPAVTPGGAVSTAFTAGGNTTLTWIRPTLLQDALQSVEILGQGLVPFSLGEAGLVVSGVAPRQVSLRSYWSATNKETAPCGLRDCNIYTEDGYTLVRAEATCFSSQVEGTIPLSLIFNSDVVDNALTNGTWTPQDYSTIDVECYAYATQQPGTVPIAAYYNGHDYWMIGSDASRTEALSRDYKYVATIGYALPASAGSDSLATVLKLSFA